jgi:hypothetical protein
LRASQALLKSTCYGLQMSVQTKNNLDEEDKELYNARLVAKGFIEKKCVDYNQVFSPIAKFAIIWPIYALIAIFDLVINQIDI